MVADRIGDWYYVRESVKSARNSDAKEPSAESKKVHRSSAEVWHRRLGHLNYRDLYVVWKKGLLQGIKLPEVNDSVQCNPV